MDKNEAVMDDTGLPLDKYDGLKTSRHHGVMEVNMV